MQRRNLPPRNLRGSLLLGPRSRLNPDTPAKENVLLKRTMWGFPGGAVVESAC